MVHDGTLKESPYNASPNRLHSNVGVATHSMAAEDERCISQHMMYNVNLALAVYTLYT